MLLPIVLHHGHLVDSDVLHCNILLIKGLSLCLVVCFEPTLPLLVRRQLLHILIAALERRWNLHSAEIRRHFLDKAMISQQVMLVFATRIDRIYYDGLVLCAVFIVHGHACCVNVVDVRVAIVYYLASHRIIVSVHDTVIDLTVAVDKLRVIEARLQSLLGNGLCDLRHLLPSIVHIILLCLKLVRIFLTNVETNLVERHNQFEYAHPFLHFSF